MTFFESYVAALNNGDVEGVVSLFADNAHFSDAGGRQIGYLKELTADGKDHLRAFFIRNFASGAPVVTLVKQSKYSMEYDVCLGKNTLPCVGCAWFDDAGLALEYIVRPR